MDYASHYDRLIARARARTLTGYKERHHVIPRCLGGKDAQENIVELTPEEHFVAHQLLVKIYPSVRGLAYAAIFAATKANSNKKFGWIKRRLSEAMRGNQRCLGRVLSPETRQKIADGNRGKKFSAERKAKIGAAQLGNKSSVGRKHSAETRAKIGAASKARARKSIGNAAESLF
jgi:hypothetical protein